MFIITSLNLDIQTQYMDILRDFLDSEYKALQYGDVYSVYQLEKSIHQTLKTIHGKRLELREKMMGVSVSDYAGKLPHNLGETLRRKMEILAKIEEECLAKTARNAGLSMSLAGEEIEKSFAAAHGFYPDMAVHGMVQ